MCTTSIIIITIAFVILGLLWKLRNMWWPPKHTPQPPLHREETSSETYVVEETNQDASFEFAPRIGPIPQAWQQSDEKGPSVVLQPKFTNPYGSQITVTLG